MHINIWGFIRRIGSHNNGSRGVLQQAGNSGMLVVYLSPSPKASEPGKLMLYSQFQGGQKIWETQVPLVKDLERKSKGQPAWSSDVQGTRKRIPPSSGRNQYALGICSLQPIRWCLPVLRVDLPHLIHSDSHTNLWKHPHKPTQYNVLPVF
jgi:hypothetical protein